MKKKISILLIFFFLPKINCQKSKKNLYPFIQKIRTFDTNFQIEKLDTLSLEEKLLFWQYNFINEYDTKSIYFDKIIGFKPQKNSSTLYKAYYNINLGDYYFYKYFSEDQKAFNFYKNALEISLLNNDKILICEALKKILTYYENIINIDDTNYKVYLSLYKKHLYDEVESYIHQYYTLLLNFKNSSQSTNSFNISDALRLEKEFEKNNLKFYQVKILRQIGIFYDLNKNYEISLNYYYKAYHLCNKLEFKMAEEQLMMILINVAIVEMEKKNFKTSIELLNKAKFKRKNKIYNKNYRYLYYWLSEVNFKQKKYKEALNYLKLSNLVEDSLKQYKHTRQIADIETKYQSEKKEKENLQLKQENIEIEAQKIRNRNLLVGSILVIVLGAIIGTLSLKNSRRKRKLAEQQKELETQKNLTLLKEQEITTINAMVDGQEKERKRIAEDLHDNLGSVLATLKLHFENLKINREKKKINQEELFNKTETLIDEAYLKVRRIAHAKNAGVIANEGLLLAVQMMAEKISSADKIKIEVTHFGLDKPLENNLEITVFRIIQELVTNILKHAEATKASINISLYDKNLNIIIEDNGKGFNTKKVNLRSGMGLSSIKTRIEYLQGNFQMDATIGKGSSMIIDIPLL